MPPILCACVFPFGYLKTVLPHTPYPLHLGYGDFVAIDFHHYALSRLR
jgi:hypothetical protein